MTCIIRTVAPRLHVIHIVSSYPDPIGPDTRASSLLLECTPQLEHTVFSFKRASWRSGIHHIGFSDPAGEGHEAIAYGAPGKGVLFKRNLDKVARFILGRIQAKGLTPDIIHGHKLTTDGYIAWRISKHLNVPFCVSLQANTDTKILKARPDMRAGYKRVWQDAALSFAFAPVAERTIAAQLGKRPAAGFNLPCPTSADEIIAPQITETGSKKRILTAFHLKHYRNKNVERLIRAIALAQGEVPEIRLEILGGGDPRSFLTVSRMANSIAPGLVTLLGGQSQASMQRKLNAATGLALLSLRESFGMVYSEALLAGTPILFSANRAVDGYFENGQYSLTADPLQVDDIARKLVSLCKHEERMKQQLGQAQASGALDFLRRDHIAATYRGALERCLSQYPVAI